MKLYEIYADLPLILIYKNAENKMLWSRTVQSDIVERFSRGLCLVRKRKIAVGRNERTQWKKTSEGRYPCCGGWDVIDFDVGVGQGPLQSVMPKKKKKNSLLDKVQTTSMVPLYFKQCVCLNNIYVPSAFDFLLFDF